MEFIRYNANNKNKLENDCTRRAISLAYKINYKEAKKELETTRDELGLKNYQYKQVVEKVISKLGYLKKINENSTVKEFAKKYNTGIYLILTKDHITTIIDGNIYDTWDCSDEIVESAYLIQLSKQNIDFNLAHYRAYIKNKVKEYFPNAFVKVNYNDNTTDEIIITFNYTDHYKFLLKVPYNTENIENYIDKIITRECNKISKKISANNI